MFARLAIKATKGQGSEHTDAEGPLLAPQAYPRSMTTEHPAPTAWSDPREKIEFSVLLANGRLAPRAFANREEAESWARPEDGEQVVSYNEVCACDM